MPVARRPAVAGLFYPADAGALRHAVARLLERTNTAPAARPRALIVPHAGYVYSGIVAAQAYARLRPWHDQISRVVLLGPPHRVAVRGIGASAVPGFETPLGTVAVDAAASAHLLTLPFVAVADQAHAPEHSLEVQLPFLQCVLAGFEIVPLLVADGDAEHVRAVLEPWWDAPDTLIVVSTDLSHFLDYEAARAADAHTDAAIMRLEPAALGPDDACGFHPLAGLLHFARLRGAGIERLMMCNSGDTAGDRERVVGYAAYAIA